MTLPSEAYLLSFASVRQQRRLTQLPFFKIRFLNRPHHAGM
jgi:hypothetical protein